jgi:hypothetical protein
MTLPSHFTSLSLHTFILQHAFIVALLCAKQHPRHCTCSSEWGKALHCKTILVGEDRQQAVGKCIKYYLRHQGDIWINFVGKDSCSQGGQERSTIGVDLKGEEEPDKWTEKKTVYANSQWQEWTCVWLESKWGRVAVVRPMARAL